MATLEQRRAGFALKRVESVRGGGDQEKFKTHLLKLPARLHTSGLGQTVAFYLASGLNSPEARICGWLEEWLREAEVYGEGRLIDWITGTATGLDGEGGRAEALYRQASAEARALAVWLKRFAEAFLRDREGGGAAAGGGAGDAAAEPGERSGEGAPRSDADAGGPRAGEAGR